MRRIAVTATTYPQRYKPPTSPNVYLIRFLRGALLSTPVSASARGFSKRSSGTCIGSARSERLHLPRISSEIREGETPPLAALPKGPDDGGQTVQGRIESASSFVLCPPTCVVRSAETNSKAKTTAKP